SKGDPHGLDARVLVAQPPVASLRALTLSTFSLSLNGFPRRAMIPEKLGSTAWTVEGCSGRVHRVPLVGYSVACLFAPRIGSKIPRWRAKFQAKNERGMKNIFSFGFSLDRGWLLSVRSRFRSKGVKSRDARNWGLWFAHKRSLR